VFRAEIGDLMDAGCKHIQLEDLGAWIPNLSGEKDFAWVKETVDHVLGAAKGAQTSWHFCLGNVWGNTMKGMTAGGYPKILPRYFDVKVDEYVLDFACREMAGIECLRELPKDKRIAAGVVDVRSLEIETPEQIAERVRKVIAIVPPERVTLTTDCGMKQLPRPVAAQKLRSLALGAEIVRREIA
jgi:5-methyltetrahydropteroyltriglutamate--homocysteine methyltransferase